VVFLLAYVLPSHRHVRFGLFFHSLALVQCLWSGSIPNDQRNRYLHQVRLNQDYIRRWISPSPVNNSTWHALIVSRQGRQYGAIYTHVSYQEAELASYQGKADAFKLYDAAVKYAPFSEFSQCAYS
jgi:hypothetical protein